MEINYEQKYILNSEWILRKDEKYTEEYTAYNINTGKCLKLTFSAYTILNIISRSPFSFNELITSLESKCIKFDWLSFEKICNKVTPEKLLEEYNENSVARNTKSISRSYEFVKTKVPLTSTPMEAEIHFTHRCNLKCLHCFQDSSPTSNKYLELNSNEWINIIEQFEDCKIRNVIISGGEPLAYKLFTKVFSQIVNKKIHYGVLTNAMLVDKNNIDLLCMPNVSLSISLDGASPKEHDVLRGTGAFDKVVEKLRMLNEREANISISCTLHKLNYLSLEKIIEYSIQLGINGIVFACVDLMGRAETNSWLGLSNDEKKNVRKKLHHFRLQYANVLDIDYSDFSEPNAITNLTPAKYVYCTAGTTRIAVSADGLLYPCVYGFGYKELVMGDLKKENLIDIWQNEDKWRLFRGGIKPTQINTCKSCELKSTCSQKNCRLKNYGDDFGIYAKPSNCMKDMLTKL